MEIQVQEHSAHIVIVTIDNQPRRNAMTRQMMAESGRGVGQAGALARALYYPDRGG